MEIVAHYQNGEEDIINAMSSSFLIHRGTTTNDDNDNDNEIIFDPPEITRMTNSSYNNNKSAVRDTSDTSRHNQSNNTRDNNSICSGNGRQNINIRDGCASVVVNTHDSILDLESQCGEGDDDEDEDTFPIICEDDEEDDNMMIALVGDELPSNSLLFDDDEHEDNFYNDLNNNSSSSISNKVRSVSPNPSPNNNLTNNNNNNTTCSSPEKKKKKKSTSSSSIMDGLTLYSVTDSFVDSLCTSTACIASSDKYNKCYTNNNSNNNKNNNKNGSALSSFQQSCHSAFFGTASCPVGQSSSHPAAAAAAGATSSGKESESCNNKVVVSMDIWQLLGCSNPPGESELESIWSLRTTPDMLRRGRAGQQQHRSAKDNNKQQHPVRASIRRRLKRIHRLRMDDRCVSGASRHGVTITTDQSYNINSNNNSSMNDDIRNDIHNKQHHQQQPSYYRAIDKSYSMMEINDPLSNFIGQGMIEPIPVEFEYDDDDAEEGQEIDGYDSDPEVNYYSASSSMIITEDCPPSSLTTKLAVSLSSAVQEAVPSTSLIDDNDSDDDAYFSEQQQHEVMQRPYTIPTDETEMRFLVQQTLNSTWTLTWHPNLENRKKYKISHNKPMCINMWLERGTVITNSGVVVEPAFMWRDAYQPLLLSQHKLNNSTQKPWSMRLLNACRVTPFLKQQSNTTTNTITNTTGTSCHPIDRTKYPMARQNSSFLLKSCGGEEFFLEAKGPNEAIAITERWKLVVARFASLAVTEDVGGIAKEFFHPTSESKMLTIADDDF